MQADPQRGAGGPHTVPVAGNPGAQRPACGIAADAAGRSLVEPVAAQWGFPEHFQDRRRLQS